MIEILDVRKKYENGIVALDGVTITVRRGEIYLLLGANGAGKTTLINLLFGFIRPTSGTLKVAGFDCEKDMYEAKRHAAFVSENVALYPQFSALQNLSFFAQLASRDILSKDVLRSYLVDVGLPEGSFDREIREFSKGMRQKLGLAIALSKRTPVIILDEPTSGLDPKAANELSETLLRLRSEGKTILMSTHDVFRARRLATNIGILKSGVLVKEILCAELSEESVESTYLSLMHT